MTKYLIISGAITVSFTNFIACGAQMYKVSLFGDHKEPSETQAANSNDPTSPEFGLHAPLGWTSLPIIYKSDRSMSKVQLAALQAAIHTWELATGKTLFKYAGVHTNVTGDSFPDLFSSLRDSVNGQYFDAHWKKTGKEVSILATTIWNNPNNGYQSIDAADIRYNAENYFISDAIHDDAPDQREIVDLQSLATHELGHLLGLAHIKENYDNTSIMNPSILIGSGLATRSLSTGDIERIQKIYGCLGKACDVQTTARTILQASLKTNLTDTADQPSH